MHYGGEGGIRTHDTLAGMPHFECGAFDHSATSPLEHDDALVSAGCLLAGVSKAGKREYRVTLSFYLDSFLRLTYATGELGTGVLCLVFPASMQGSTGGCLGFNGTGNIRYTD